MGNRVDLSMGHCEYVVSVFVFSHLNTVSESTIGGRISSNFEVVVSIM